jgi:hypothetical protein
MNLGTHRSLQSARDATEKEKSRGGADGAGPNWEKWKKMERKRRKGKWRGDGVFPSSAELMVGRARRERRRLGLL